MTRVYRGISQSDTVLPSVSWARSEGSRPRQPGSEVCVPATWPRACAVWEGGPGSRQEAAQIPEFAGGKGPPQDSQARQSGLSSWGPATDSGLTSGSLRPRRPLRSSPWLWPIPTVASAPLGPAGDPTPPAAQYQPRGPAPTPDQARLQNPKSGRHRVREQVGTSHKASEGPGGGETGRRGT